MAFISDVDFFDYLADQNGQHARTSDWWNVNDRLIRADVASHRAIFDARAPFQFGPLGEIRFPYFQMGSVDSLDLFGLDELLLFAFYWRNRSRYQRAVDIGANIGLHTVVMASLGWDVASYEPDPAHVTQLFQNLHANDITSVRVVTAAVNTDGTSVDFTRVVGNTTGSHITGAKLSPYGELERFMVDGFAVADVFDRCDLVKMDVEGYEANLLLALDIDTLEGIDVVGEIGSAHNAKLIFERFDGTSMHLFSQKINWARVGAPEELPTSHREGSFFLSSKAQMPWT